VLESSKARHFYQHQKVKRDDVERERQLSKL